MADRLAQLETDLVAAGMAPEAAQRYIRERHGWKTIQIRPATLDDLRELGRLDGMPMHGVIQTLIDNEKGEREVDKRENLHRRFVNRPWSPSFANDADWAGFYPVVSKGVVIAIFDAAWPAGPYARKPIVDDVYIDADAEDEPR